MNEIKPGIAQVVHQGRVLMEFDIARHGHLSESGALIRHCGSVYQVVHAMSMYSANVDSFDACIEVVEMPMFSILEQDELTLRALREDAEASGLSEAAYLRSAAKLKQSINVVLRDPARARQFRDLMGLPDSPGCGVIE